MPSNRTGPRALFAEVHELQRQIEVASADRLDRALQVVALLARDADLIAHDLRLHLQLGVLHDLDEIASPVRIDALLQLDLLLGAAARPGLDRAEIDGLER